MEPAKEGSGGTSVESHSQAELGDGPDVITIEDVQNWLERIGYDTYKKVFEDNGVDGAILKTLTSEELRGDLDVVNLSHRRDILNGIQKLNMAARVVPAEGLPEHGRILDHLSNVRTYHSWIRVGVQLLGFAVVTLRLSPVFLAKGLVIGASLYFATVGTLSLLYGIYRYKTVITMIEQSGAKTPAYDPDKVGVWSMLILVGIASVLSLTMIFIRFL